MKSDYCTQNTYIKLNNYRILIFIFGLIHLLSWQLSM